MGNVGSCFILQSNFQQSTASGYWGMHHPHPELAVHIQQILRKDGKDGKDANVHVREPFTSRVRISAVHPAGPFKTCWNMLVALCVLHDLVIIPVCFGPQNLMVVFFGQLGNMAQGFTRPPANSCMMLHGFPIAG